MLGGGVCRWKADGSTTFACESCKASTVDAMARQPQASTRERLFTSFFATVMALIITNYYLVPFNMSHLGHFERLCTCLAAALPYCSQRNRDIDLSFFRQQALSFRRPHSHFTVAGNRRRRVPSTSWSNGPVCLAPFPPWPRCYSSRSRPRVEMNPYLGSIPKRQLLR